MLSALPGFPFITDSIVCENSSHRFELVGDRVNNAKLIPFPFHSGP